MNLQVRGTWYILIIHTASKANISTSLNWFLKYWKSSLHRNVNFRLSKKCWVPITVIKKGLYSHESGIAGPKYLSKALEGGRGQAKGKQTHLLKTLKQRCFFQRHLLSPTPPTPKPQGKSRGPSSQIHSADKSVSEPDTPRWRKKEKRTNFLDFFFSLQEKKRFPLADEGKGPFNIFFFSARWRLPD